MKQRKSILAKTLALSAVIGVIVGALCALFGRVLLYLSEVRSLHAIWFIPFLGVAGLISMLLYKKCSEESLKGMGLVIETGLGKNEKIPILLVPLIMVSTWLTHLFGGSAGREGVAVQLGATVAHTIGRKAKMPENSRVLLITGMAAGFAGLFQTPLTASFFALEVMISGVLLYEALLPAVMAAYIASFTSHFLGLEKFSVAVNDAFSWTPETIVKLLFVAAIFGVTGGGFAYLLGKAKKAGVRFFQDPCKRIFVMGSLLAIVFLLLDYGRYSGLGTNLISASFNGEMIYGWDFILKILLTVLTLAAGYQGGEVTPLFAIGASLGVVLAKFLGLPILLVAALGYAAVFGAATNTLLAPIFVGLEVFGGNHMTCFAVVCIIAYVCSGSQTIYGAQRKYIFQIQEGE